jgi:hypothetical protein
MAHYPEIKKTIVSWKNNQLYFDNTPTKLKGFGLYFVWERKLTKEYLHNLFKYLRSYDFNMVRIFLLSTFQRKKLQLVGVPTWQIFKKNNQGKYDLNVIDKEWLVYIRDFCEIASWHGIAIQLVLCDMCGFKQYGTDQYGWNTHPFNHRNNVNGKYQYDGSAYFKYYHIERDDKYPGMKQLWQKMVQATINAVCQCGNVMIDNNELTQEQAHDAYGHLQNFMNHLRTWTLQQYERSGSPYKPVFTSSDEKAYFWGTDKVQIQWAHDHLSYESNYNGSSTDGFRSNQCGSVQDFQTRMQHLWNHGKHIELHLAFLHTFIGWPPEDLTALVWGNNPLVQPEIHWEKHLKPYLLAMKNIR